MKPIFASWRITARRVNASARKITSRSCCVDLLDQPLPERERLGVRVVDAEDLDAGVDPVDDDPPPRLPQRAPVRRVPVEVVDVLVALGRVLGVLERAVGALQEPLRVLGQPRVVGRRVEREVERDVDAVLGRGGASGERTSSSVPSSGWTASWPPSLPPIAYGEPGSSRAGDERVVAALAVLDADRVDRREVEHVEAELGEPRHLRLDRLEAAERAREQLVPGAEAGARRGRPRAPAAGRSVVAPWRSAARSTAAHSSCPSAASCLAASGMSASSRTRSACSIVLRSPSSARGRRRPRAARRPRTARRRGRRPGRRRPCARSSSRQVANTSVQASIVYSQRPIPVDRELPAPAHAADVGVELGAARPRASRCRPGRGSGRPRAGCRGRRGRRRRSPSRRRRRSAWPG